VCSHVLCEPGDVHSAGGECRPRQLPLHQQAHAASSRRLPAAKSGEAPLDDGDHALRSGGRRFGWSAEDFLQRIALQVGKAFDGRIDTALMVED